MKHFRLSVMFLLLVLPTAKALSTDLREVVWNPNLTPQLKRTSTLMRKTTVLQPGTVSFVVEKRGSELQDCGYFHKRIILDHCTQTRTTLVSDYRKDIENPENSEEPDPFYFDCATTLNGTDVIAKVATWIVLHHYEGVDIKTFFSNLKITWAGNEEPWYDLGGVTFSGDNINHRTLKAWAAPSTNIPAPNASQPFFREGSCTPEAPQEFIFVTASHEDPNDYVNK